ncbi:MAG: 2,3-bisphosphoglycerate-independent phosphoglycerate mutase [Candidatus Shapirobacteria bacterium]|nr:2,3-bisphosphoglycerate-independent phosphoglycerate mutase [Candidatus Shapirobacteria bacterium]
MNNKKVILIVRDGWGYSTDSYGNAIMVAKTPNNDKYIREYPSILLKCTGMEVGNPESAQGGSEVGHLTLGAGRIVWQPQEIINQSIENGSFFKNPALLGAIENCKKNNSALHLSGLLSDAGVHGDINHLFALLKLAKNNGLNEVFVHVVADGRDVGEKSVLGYIEKLENKIEEIGVGKIASVIGRYYAMDRDTSWEERTKVSYELMTIGKGFTALNAKEAVESAYSRGDKTDYYIQATVIIENEKPVALIKKEDSFVWFNFRTDRSRQITAMMEKLDFCPQQYWGKINPYYVGMCRYDQSWNLPVAYEQETIKNNLAEVLAKNGKTQLRVAETEKFAHVTFFFNSQQEKKYIGEDRIVVPSSKVESYDLKPEMSAFEIKDKVIENIGKYDFILINFANPDLVGHSGIFKAAVKACEVVDECVGEIVEKAEKNNYCVIVGADHGNAEEMLYVNGEIDASHGYNQVMYSFIDKDLEKIKLKKNKGLKDIAPTILQIMGIEKPIEMTGESLIVND